MAGNQVTLTFAGDEKNLTKSTDRVGRAMAQVGSQVGTTESAFDTAARSSSRFGAALDTSAGFSGTLADGADGVAMATEAVGDAMNYSERRAANLARAQTDVAQAALDAEQAVADMAQAFLDAAQSELDSEQAAIDMKQALIDQSEAQKEYNEAVREHGAASAEARQAAVDLEQAQLDAKQAAEDEKQAQEDLRQARIDGGQAAVDGADAATRLGEAQRELERQGSVMSDITEGAGLLSGILGGLAGIIGTVVAVQWAWNVAMTANPIGLVIAGIALLIGAVVLIATKTTWFQDLWRAIWSKIGDPVKNAWDWVKRVSAAGLANITSIPGRIRSAFSQVGEFISRPFRAGFNAVRAAWNNTVGGRGFTIPGWVPGVGGNSFRFPTFHTGGVVSGALGSETLAVLQAGERVTAGRSSGGSGSAGEGRIVGEVVIRGRDLVVVLREQMRGLGGDPGTALAPR